MELIVDDREHSIIRFLDNITIKRITIGDYIFMFNGVIVMIIERKTLADLAASIKDGRMANNDKLIDAQKASGCKLVYIIEGPAYPKLTSKFGRMPYKCLQGKLDSLMFRHNINIIYTKDEKHTAERLTGLSKKLTKMIEMGDIKCDSESSLSITKTVPICKDLLHIKMVQCIPSVSFKMATVALQKFTLSNILLGNLDAKECYNLRYESGICFGIRGEHLLNITDDTKISILACIKGVSKSCAETILNHLNFTDVVNGTYPIGAISELKHNNRRIGVLEKRIRLSLCI